MHRLLASLIACLVTLEAPAAADTGRTVRAEFFPAFLQGQLVGCQASFSVLRMDEEFSQGAPTLANGLIVVYGNRAERAGAMVRLGVASSDTDFSPPERAFLIRGFRTNAAEVGESFLSDATGFRVFPYALGDVTMEAVVSLATEQRLEIGYGMPGTIADARIEVDFSAYPEVTRAWSECVLTVFD